MSEFNEFPVLTEISNVENCCRAVSQSDIFILILGGKRGSVEPLTGKSIVQMEFECSDGKGLANIIFVRKPILDLLTVWEKNAGGDFTPHVDSSEVFKFVKELKARQQWIYQFETAEQIEAVLKMRLSELFRHLLERSRAGRLDPLREFINESSKAQFLAREKPQYWEFLLTGELIESRLAEVNRKVREVEDGLVLRPVQSIPKSEVFSWLRTKLADLQNSIQVLVAWSKEMQAAWGPRGKPGDPLAIKRATDRLFAVCDHLIDWEIELRFTLGPDIYEELFRTMRNSTKGVFEQLNTFPGKLLQPFADGQRPTGSLEINLHFDSPGTLPSLNAEMERLRIKMQERPFDFA